MYAGNVCSALYLVSNIVAFVTLFRGMPVAPTVKIRLSFFFFVSANCNVFLKFP